MLLVLLVPVLPSCFPACSSALKSLGHLNQHPPFNPYIRRAACRVKSTLCAIIIIDNQQNHWRLFSWTRLYYRYFILFPTLFFRCWLGYGITKIFQKELKWIHTRHLALAKFFSNWAHTPSLRFFSEAPFPAILAQAAHKWARISVKTCQHLFCSFGYARTITIHAKVHPAQWFSAFGPPPWVDRRVPWLTEKQERHEINLRGILCV